MACRFLDIIYSSCQAPPLVAPIFLTLSIGNIIGGPLSALLAFYQFQLLGYIYQVSAL